MKTDLSAHMDDIIERLMHEDLKGEELDKLVKIAKTVNEVARTVTDMVKVNLEEKKLKIEALKVLSEAGFIPKSLADDVIKTNLIEQNILNNGSVR